MENKICPSCKTENEPEYSYCKNCGNPLSSPESHKTTAYEQQNENNGGAFIDGNPIDNVATFVGKNADKILPKFIKINQGGSKVQWCWPPFLWGFFLGPIGVAIWFLYRKMYKPACIFGAISVVSSYIVAFVNHFFEITGNADDILDGYLNSFMYGRHFNLEEFLQMFTSREMIITNIMNTYENLINLACALIAGLFAIYIYKKHTAKKISLFRPISGDPNYIKIGLAANGGTSVGAAILGFIIISVIASILSIIFSTIKLAEVMYRL